MPGALDIVTLREQAVVFGQDVTDVAHERQPRRSLRRSHAQATAIERAIDDGAKFVPGDARRQPTQRGFDIGSFGQSLSATLYSSPLTPQGAGSGPRCDVLSSSMPSRAGMSWRNSVLPTPLNLYLFVLDDAAHGWTLQHPFLEGRVIFELAHG